MKISNVRIKRTADILAICALVVTGAVLFPMDAIIAKESLRMSLEKEEKINAPVLEQNRVIAMAVRNMKPANQ